jgi:chromosome partitioning protein
VIARQTAQALAVSQPPALRARIGQRVVFADAARTGRLVSETSNGVLAAREVAALVAEIERLTP